MEHSFYHRIAERLDKNPKDAGPEPESRTEWTIYVKRIMIELAREEMFSVACGMASHTDKGVADWIEWLYDLVWYTEGPAQDVVKATRSVELVMEVEWDRGVGAISIDFDKLLVANAPLRVMLCQAKSVDETKEILAYCNGAVQRYVYHSATESILLCIWPLYAANAEYHVLRKNFEPQRILHTQDP